MTEELTGSSTVVVSASPPATPEELKTAAEIVKLEAETAKLMMEAEEIQRRNSWNAATPGHADLTYAFTGAVSASTVWDCMQTLAAWTRRSPGADVKIILSTPGGSIVDGFALMDYLATLQEAGHHIEIVALGYAASMGGVILQQADHRVIGKNGYILVHEATTWVGGSMGQIEDDIDFTKRLQDRILEIFEERTTFTKAQLKRKWSRKDWWLDAAESLEFGFVDEIR